MDIRDLIARILEREFDPGASRRQFATIADVLATELELSEEEVVDFTGGAEVRYITRTYPLS